MDGLHHRATKMSGSTNVFGILYAEDFDNPSELDCDRFHDRTKSEPLPPAIAQADVNSACAVAVQAARVEWQLEDEQMRLKAIASIGPMLMAIQNASEISANALAESTVITILSIVTGLLPHFSREHGAEEVRALLDRLLPTIRSQARINVRVHSDLVAIMQRDIAMLEPDQAALIDVTAAPLERGDVKVSWENGSMARDSRKIMQAVLDALGELGLRPTVEAPTKKRMAYAD